jgi:hypothetical protein
MPKKINPILAEYAGHIAEMFGITTNTALRLVKNGERIKYYRAKAPPRPKNRGFNPNKPGILYYLRVDRPGQESLYKIGITNKTIKHRHRADFGMLTILRERRYQNGAEAYRLESEIIQNNISFLYRGPAVLRSGNSELFEKNILDSFPQETGKIPHSSSCYTRSNS